MKNKTMPGIAALILLLAIGFAAVSTTLVINGVIRFGPNLDDFDVIFTKAVLDGIDVSSTVISEDQKQITYTTNELKYPEDKSTLEFEIKNNSTQYDAEVEVECETTGTNANDLYKIEETVPETIIAQTREQGNISVTLMRSIVEEISETFVCTLTVSAVERTETAVAFEDDASGIVFSPRNTNWEVTSVEEALNYLKERGN